MTTQPKATGDRAKLPKWAQRDFEILDMRLREANDQIDELHDALGKGEDRDDATIYLAESSYPERLTPLPKRARIKFKLGDKHWIEAKVTTRRGEPAVELSTQGGMPVIAPWAGNVIHAWEVER